MKLDTYSFKARIAPTAVTALIPILVFNHFFVSEEFRKLLGDILGLKFFSALTISAISIIFLAELSRAISKLLFQKVYKDELSLPTTRFILYTDPTYSEDFKNRFRACVLKDFKITLPTIIDENENIDESRKRIAESVVSIRKKLHNNIFLMQHNIEYGALRNSLGGAFLAVIFSGLNIIMFRFYFINHFAVKISICSFLLYALLLAIGPWLIQIYGRSYAKILFREYMK